MKTKQNCGFKIRSRALKRLMQVGGLKHSPSSGEQDSFLLPLVQGFCPRNKVAMEEVLTIKFVLNIYFIHIYFYMQYTLSLDVPSYICTDI